MVRAGATWDGTNVRTYDHDLVTANLGPNAKAYGDPVFSRMADGRWTMTAWVPQRLARVGWPRLLRRQLPNRQ